MSDAVSTEASTTAAPVIEPETKSDGEPVDEIAAALAAVEAEGEPKAEEPKKEAKADEPEKKDDKKEEDGPAAKGWAAVRRIEQKLTKRQKEFEQREQQTAARAQQLEETLKRVQQREAELDGDPVAFFAKKGLSFDDLAKRYLNDGKASPEEAGKRAAAQQSETLKAQEERLARIEQSIKQREIESHLSDYRSKIKTTLADAEFELLQAMPDAEAEVYEFADKWARKTNEVLTPRDAALKLQDEARKYLTSLSSHQAVRSLLTGANGAQSKQVVSGQSQVPRGPGASSKTLTNNLAATPAVSEPDFDSLSEDDQIQAALRLVQDA